MENYSQVNDYPAGDLRVVVLSVTSAGGGSDTLSMQPDAQGKEDIILAAWAYHNDATARAMQWQIYDALNTTTAIMESSGAVAAYIKHSLYNIAAGLGRGGHQFSMPMKATRQVYPQCVFTSLDAGDIGYIHAIVLRRYGNAA
jgi:hypothetical protein